MCETIHALELHDETPSWKIMDNKGRVTVVLHWDQRQNNSGIAGNTATGNTIINSSSTCNGPLLDKFSPSKRSGGGISAQSSIDKSTMQQRYPSPQITVINHDDMQSTIYNNSRRLSKQGGSFDSAVGAVHIHTPECSHHVHTPSRAGSPSAAECDFHCCALVCVCIFHIETNFIDLRIRIDQQRKIIHFFFHFN